MLAEQADLVIGVDTHRDTHTLAAVSAASGRVRAELSITADPAGYRRALTAAAGHGGRRVWAVEGTGSYGAGLTRHLQAAGERVLEVERPARGGQRRGKSDALDAVRAARSVLAGAGTPPRGGPAAREAIRVLMVARAAEVETRAKALTRIRALVIGAPAPLRARLQPLGPRGLMAACAALGDRADGDPVEGATCAALGALGHLALTAAGHADLHERRIAGLVATIPASSGQVVRHRLDRGGDRQLNRALHTILLSRRRHHPPTRAYITRRTTEGKTTREATRCLKRYLARHLFRLLEATPHSH